jgi:hypothetical protein
VKEITISKECTRLRPDKLMSSEISRQCPPFNKIEGSLRVHNCSLFYPESINTYPVSLRQTADRTQIFGGIYKETSNVFIPGAPYEQSSIHCSDIYTIPFRRTRLRHGCIAGKKSSHEGYFFENPSICKKVSLLQL